MILEHGQNDIFLEYLKEKNLQFVYFNININIYLFFLIIINFKRISQLNYYKLAIQLANPRIVITATDNNINFID